MLPVVLSVGVEVLLVLTPPGPHPLRLLLAGFETSSGTPPRSRSLSHHHRTRLAAVFGVLPRRLPLKPRVCVRGQRPNLRVLTGQVGHRAAREPGGLHPHNGTRALESPNNLAHRIWQPSKVLAPPPNFLAPIPSRDQPRSLATCRPLPCAVIQPRDNPVNLLVAIHPSPRSKQNLVLPVACGPCYLGQSLRYGESQSHAHVVWPRCD